MCAERRSDQRGNLGRSLDASPCFHELPTEITNHRFLGQARQRKQPLEQPAEHTRHRIVAISTVAITGAALQALQAALQRPDDEPRVDRQLVADHVECIEHMTDCVRNRPWPLLVDHEREQFVGRVVEQGCSVVADETRICTGDARQRLKHHRQRRWSGSGCGVGELVAASRDRANEANSGLGALCVPSQPEEMFCSSRREDPRWRVGPHVATGRHGLELALRLRAEDPDVLRARARSVRDRCADIARRCPAESTGHRNVGITVGNGERSQHG